MRGVAGVPKFNNLGTAWNKYDKFVEHAKEEPESHHDMSNNRHDLHDAILVAALGVLNDFCI